MEIRKITLPLDGVDWMQAEALAEGYNFIDTLIDDWADGSNRFDGPGEILLASFDRDVLIAVGGLNVDPFCNDATIGRIRRVYVRTPWRNQGVGAALMMALLEDARNNFKCVRLRAESADAARLYERLGFIAIENTDATHILRFEDR